MFNECLVALVSFLRDFCDLIVVCGEDFGRRIERLLVLLRELLCPTLSLPDAGVGDLIVLVELSHELGAFISSFRRQVSDTDPVLRHFAQNCVLAAQLLVLDRRYPLLTQVLFLGSPWLDVEGDA